MNVNPQLAVQFDGQCEAAFKLYENYLGGTVTFMLTWAKSPAVAEVPAEWGPKIYHATLKVGGTVIMASDQPPDRYQRPAGYDIVLQIDDPAAADRIFNGLADGGTIKMPLQETFWAPRFGALIDRFGIPWVVNCEQRGAETA